MEKYTKSKKLYNKIERLKRELEHATKNDLQFEAQNDFAKTHYNLAIRELENMLKNLDIPIFEIGDKVIVSKNAVVRDEVFRMKTCKIVMDDPIMGGVKVQHEDHGNCWVDYGDFKILK